MPDTVCPFCFRKINSSHLAFQCAGRGNIECKKELDGKRKRLTGSELETFPTFLPPEGRGASTNCPTCGGPAKRRACPACHTALPIDFVDSRSPMIGLVGAKGSGKTVLMTVLVKQLREVVGRRFSADIRIATDNPDGLQGLSDYQANREVPLYSKRTLPVGTGQQGSGTRERTTPVVLRWRQEAAISPCAGPREAFTMRFQTQERCAAVMVQNHRRLIPPCPRARRTTPLWVT